MPTSTKRKASAKKQQPITQHAEPRHRAQRRQVQARQQGREGGDRRERRVGGGSKLGRAVPASEIGLNADAWELNQELEGFLAYPCTRVQDSSCLARARLPLAPSLSSRLPLARSLSSRLPLAGSLGSRSLDRSVVHLRACSQTPHGPVLPRHGHSNKSKFKPPLQQARSATCTTPSFVAKAELTSRSRWWAEWLYS